VPRGRFGDGAAQQHRQNRLHFSSSVGRRDRPSAHATRLKRQQANSRYAPSDSPTDGGEPDGTIPARPARKQPVGGLHVSGEPPSRPPGARGAEAHTRPEVVIEAIPRNWAHASCMRPVALLRPVSLPPRRTNYGAGQAGTVGSLAMRQRPRWPGRARRARSSRATGRRPRGSRRRRDRYKARTPTAPPGDLTWLRSCAGGCPS
jgi:hypothetical protein